MNKEEPLSRSAYRNFKRTVKADETFHSCWSPPVTFSYYPQWSDHEQHRYEYNDDNTRVLCRTESGAAGICLHHVLDRMRLCDLYVSLHPGPPTTPGWNHVWHECIRCLLSDPVLARNLNGFHQLFQDRSCG